MNKKSFFLVLLLVGLFNTNYAQSLWKLIPLFPMNKLGAIEVPGIDPLSVDTERSTSSFYARQNESSISVTSSEPNNNVQVVIVNDMDIVVYDNITYIPTNNILSISTIGWQEGEYTIYIISNGNIIGGTFQIE